MDKSIGRSAIVGMILAACGLAQATGIEFNTFNIRNHNGTIAAPWDSNMSITENSAGDGFSAVTPDSGQKVGYGTSFFDNQPVNKLSSVTFTKNSGIANIPYLNLWVTDGTHYAILAATGDYRGNNFATTATAWALYEYAGSIDWLFKGTGGTASPIVNYPGGFNLTDLNDNIVFADPGSPYPSYVSTGAPRGGDGFNVVFGDTQANYVGAFSISDLSVTYDGTTYDAGSVPDAGSSLMLLGMALTGLSVVARRCRSN
jgi:hypothetical protein